MNIILESKLYDGDGVEPYVDRNINEYIRNGMPNSINFDTYQKWTRHIRRYPQELAVIYNALGMSGEAGEVNDKLCKIIRDCNGDINENTKSALVYEIADVLWYLARLSDELGIKLSEVVEASITKVQKRIDNDTIHGDGDDR